MLWVHRTVLIIAAVLPLVLIARVAHSADPLPALGVDLSQTSISGLSSGAYMAGQFHVAHSETIIGVGIVAGGPFGCAENWLVRSFPSIWGASYYNAMQAQYGCMQTYWGAPDPEGLADRAAELAEEDLIDPIDALKGDRVYLFWGRGDDTVTEPVVAATAEFYKIAGVAPDDILFLSGSPAAHAFVTDDVGSACGTSGSPFLNDCSYDQAGAILEHIYGSLTPPADTAPAGTFLSFDQSAFLAEPTARGMAETGLLYVSPDCADTAGCRVHVALHGCRQNAAAVGEAFSKGSGFARWGDQNRLIILLPQSSESPGNPRACWDWWGYADPDFRSRNAPQIAAIRAMLDRLAEPIGN